MKNENETILGRVSEVRKNRFVVSLGGEGRDHEGFHEEVMAKLKGSFYDRTPDQLPVVGDYVRVAYNPMGDSVILSVQERTSFLQRPDQAKTGVMQYMAANVDYCFIVTALNEDFSVNRIARYTGTILQGGAVPVAVLTKSDLCPDADCFIREVEAISDRLRVHAVSALHGSGMEALQAYFEPGRTICLLGSSGAGKSTLINAIIGEEIMKTSAVRASDSTGRHTTTHRRLITLDSGVSLIDTPGMREIGMAQAEEGIDDTFRDIVELESRCRFRNCRHETEPGCAVKAAIESGVLSAERLRLYQNLGRENTNNSVRKKEIAKWQKAYKKSKLR